MEDLSDLPVLILVYNRYEKFHRCINNLFKQGIKKIFISIDGPKNKFDLNNQKKIIKFCRDNPLGIKIKINKLDINYGCRVGPIKGITWFFQQNRYGVVFEDDVIISNECINAFSFLLKKYLNNKKYMSISSFNEFTNKDIESIYSYPVWRSWGWGTWSEKWNDHLNFSKKIKDFNIWQLYKLLPKDLKSIETAKLVKSSQLNLLDAWDYEFNFSHVVNNKSSLTIGGINTFVYGFDDSATHTVDLNSIGIDFDLFCERKFNLGKVIKADNKQNILVLNKCGFFYLENNSNLINILSFLKYFLFEIIFRLRIIKRIIYKIL